LYFAEPSFFDIFNFEWLAGNPKTALSAPNTVILTRETAERYFGDWKSAIGRTIKYNNQALFQVTGILKDIPSNSDLPLKLVVSYNSLKNVDLSDWVGTYGRGYCFVKLSPTMSTIQFNAGLHSFIKKHKPADHVNEGLLLQPLADMHFNSSFDNYNGRVFSKSLISILWMIAMFLLVIACINFINLATAQSVNRSKEVGVRKVLGGNRRQLIAQFLCETGLITLFAVCLAISFAAFSIPSLNNLLNVDLHLDLKDPQVFALLMGIMPALPFCRASILHWYCQVTILSVH